MGKQSSVPASSPVVSGGSGLDAALRKLFEAFSRKSDKTVGIEDFVDAQAVLVAAHGGSFDKGKEVAEYFDLTLSGPLGLGKFSHWWLERFSDRCPTGDEAAAEAACVQDLKTLTGEGEATSSSALAGTGASAARSLRGGGGHSSAAKGFVESGSQIMSDLDSFDNFLKGGDGDSSDDDNQKLKKAIGASTVDADIAELAVALRDVRRKRRAAKTTKEAEAHRASERSLGSQLRQLFRRRQKELQGKLVITGNVNSKGEKIRNADLKLSLDSSLLVSTKSDGAGQFEQSVEARLGRGMTLTAEKEGFAKASKRVGGDGVRHVRFELLALKIKGRFKAKPLSKDVEVFADQESGVSFEVPVGEICKDGLPWDGEVEFSAAVVDASGPSGLESMPPLTGRSVGGGLMPMQSLGCVYVDLKDPSDNSSLSLTPEGGGIEARLPSTAPLPQQQPSVWHYDEAAGQWEETMQPLAVNGSELPPPKPEEASPPSEIDSDALAAEQEVDEKDLQSSRAKLDEQRKEDGEQKICTCGFKSKMAILPFIHKSHDLAKADPPKRIFASTEIDRSGKFTSSYPYLTEDEQVESARKAAEHREVILSHHLVNACEVLGRPWSIAQEKNSLFYDGEGRQALPSLAVIADWLLEKIVIRDKETSELVGEVDPAVLQLKVLEKMAGYWAHTRYDYSVGTSGPTLEEMQIALEDCCGNVGHALLAVAAAQARRSEVARVRLQLQQENPHMTARYSLVDKALDAAKRDVNEAVSILMKDPEINRHVERLETREKLFKVMPMAHPSSKQVEAAIEKSGGDLGKAAELLRESPEVQEGAKEVYKTWSDTLKAAAEDDTNNFTFQIKETGWNNVDAPAKSAVLDDAVINDQVRPPLEFYPRQPKPLCPAGDSSLVLGGFDDGVFAVRATAADLGYRGIDYTEQVQPDGTFSLNVLGRARFEIRTKKADGTDSFTFGPFYASRGLEVTHIGLLSPPRDDGTKWEDLVSSVDIILPALEFPPHGGKEDTEGEVGEGEELHFEEERLWSHWLGTWVWDEPEADLMDLDARRSPMLLPQPRASTFTLKIAETEDLGIECVMGEYRGWASGRGDKLEPGIKHKISFYLDDGTETECCQRGFLEIPEEGLLPEQAWFSFEEDSSYWRGAEGEEGSGTAGPPKVKVRRTQDTGEKCTCFETPGNHLPGSEDAPEDWEM